MPPRAYLTILWGATPIRVAHVPPGRSVGITAGGVITRAPSSAGVAVLVRAHAGGITVSRGASEGGLLPAGAEAEIPITEASGAPIYRRGVAFEPVPVMVRVVATAEEPRIRRRPALAARLVAALASVAAVHAVALGISSALMPPLSPFTAAALISEADAPSFQVEASPVEPFYDAPYEDRFGDSPAVCEFAPPVGHSIAVRGADDNPDPHIARHYARFDDLIFDGIGPLREAIDELAPLAPWGRDDAYGRDPFSARGTAVGRFEHAMWSTCFGAPPETWSCAGNDELPAPVAPESIGLAGIGEAQPQPPEPLVWLGRRPARVVMSPIAIAANIPRWPLVAGIHDLIDQARTCYARALVDDADLSGQLDVVVKVRGDDVSAELAPRGSLARSPALSCCVAHAHDYLSMNLPKGTRATARYSITFGQPDPAPAR